MKRKTKGFVTAALALLPLFAIAGTCCRQRRPAVARPRPRRDGSVPRHPGREEAGLQGAQRSTAPSTSCIANGAKGAMGIHMVNVQAGRRREAPSDRAGSPPLREALQRHLQVHRGRVHPADRLRSTGRRHSCTHTPGAEDERHGRRGILRVADVSVHAARVGLEAEPDRRVQLLEHAGVLLADRRESTTAKRARRAPDKGEGVRRLRASVVSVPQPAGAPARKPLARRTCQLRARPRARRPRRAPSREGARCPGSR